MELCEWLWVCIGLVRLMSSTSRKMAVPPTSHIPISCGKLCFEHKTSGLQPQQTFINSYNGPWKVERNWWLSSLRLFRSMDIAYCMAMVLMFWKMLFILAMKMSKVLLRSSMDDVCVDALASVVITMSIATFHPQAAILLKYNCYMSIFFKLASI